MADDDFDFGLDDVTIENYVYSCEESQAIEHCECFSYSEAAEVRPNSVDFGRSVSGWKALDNGTKQDYIQAWFQNLETTNDALRTQSLNALVHIVQGVPHEADDSDAIKEACKLNCGLLKDCGILHTLSTVLPYLVDGVDQLTAQFDDQLFAATEVKESSSISEEVLANAEYWNKFKQLRHCFSILYCCLLWNRDDEEFVHACMTFPTSGKPLLVYCFDLLTADRWVYYPLKKLVCFLRLLLLLNLGPIVSNHLTLNHNPNDKSSNSYSHRPPKARTHHLMDSVEKFSQSFSPIFVKQGDDEKHHTQFDSFTPLPKAVRESLHLLSSNLYNPKALHSGGVETPDESTVSLVSISETISEEPSESKGDEDGDTVPAATTTAKQLYGWLVPNLDKHVTRMLQLLIAAEPSTGHVPGVPDVRLELVINPLVPDIYPLDFGRHREIILKSLSFILLKLLKIFKQHDYGSKEFQYLCTLLQQRNCIPLLLKWLNKKKLYDSCLLNSDIPELSVLHPSHSEVEASVVLNNIVEAKQAAEVSTRKCAAYIHLLRILVKMTKHSPLHLYAQVILKSHDICKMLWKNMYQPDFQLYILKNFKNMMKYITPRWKETSMNMKIVSAVFHTVRMDLIDTWMDQAELSRAQHMGLVQRLQDQREGLAIYNAKHYGVKSASLDIRPSKFMPTLSEDEASHMVHVETAKAHHDYQLDETSLAFYDVLLTKELQNINDRFFSLNGFAFLRSLNVDKALNEILPEDQ